MGWQKKCFLSIFIVLFCSSSFAKRPNFKTTNITVNNIKLKVELALNDEQRAYGMMNLAEFPKEIDGMLFIFDREKTLSFWMKNTQIPLSIAYFDENKRLINILKMEPESIMVPDHKLKKYKSLAPVKYALEVPKSWFQKKGIHPGHRLSIGNY